MSGGGTTTSKVENKDPWAPAQPYLQDIMGQASQLYKSGAGGQTYGGPLVANYGDDTWNAFSQTRGLASVNTSQPFNFASGVIGNNGMAPGTQPGIAALGNIAANSQNPTSSATNLAGMASGADAGKNPYLLQMLDDNAQRIGNRVASQMSGAGRFGSFSHGDALARSITAANAPILSGAYESDRNRQLQANAQIDSAQRGADASGIAAGGGLVSALQGGQGQALQAGGMMPTFDALRYAGADRLGNLGSMFQNIQQQQIEASRKQFEQDQQQPWTQLNRYLGGVSGLGGLIGNAGTTTGNVTQEQQTPWTTYAGLGIAGLGLLSDRNEKTDIRKIGKDEATGLPLYSYRYKDDPKTYPKIVGPMAQDVEKAFPGSTERVGGKLYIKNGALGIAGL